MPILTLAIPAFQDSDALRSTLNSILETIDAETIGQIEIIVSDNSSEDDTYHVACQLLRGKPFGKVIKQAENIGFSRNLLSLAHAAKGDFIWFIGLGERVTEGSVHSLVSYLGTESPDWGVLKGYFDFQEVARTPDLGFAKGVSSEENSVPALSHVISLNVFKTQHARNLQLDKGFPANDFWPHFEIVGQLAAKSRSNSLRWFYFDTTAILIARNKHGAWDFKELALDIFLEWGKIFSRLSGDLPMSGWIKTRYRELCGRHLLEFVFMIAKFGTLGRPLILQQVWQASFLPLGTRILATLVALLPRALLRGLAGVRRTLFAH